MKWHHPLGLALFAGFLAAFGCTSIGGGGGGDEAAKLAAQYIADEPLNDARENYNRGDYRIFVVVKGMRGFYPGIDPTVGSYYEQRYGAAELPGASDYFDSDDHPEFVSAATNYASVYNRAMTNLLFAMEQGGAGGP